MNILFDMTITQPTADTKFIGSGEYAIRIFTRLLNMLKKDDAVTVLYRKGFKRCEAVDSICEDNQINILFYSTPVQLSAFIRQYQIDTVFFPLQYPEYEKLTVSDDVRIISVLHDLAWIDEIEMKSHYGMELGFTHWLYSEMKMRFVEGREQIDQFIRMFQKSLAINKNQTVITVSDYTKSKMCGYIGIKPEKIRVLYSPPKVADKIDDEAYENEVLRQYGCEKDKYILLISASRWRKNVLRALEALNLFFAIEAVSGRKCGYKVVVLGADEEHRQYFNKIVRPKDRFVICDYVKKEELEALYKNAGLFMYPSLLEGFGYPPLEAMKYGTACICSNSMSIPEVCGDAAVYFNGFKRLSMVKALFTALIPANREILKKRAARRYNEIQRKQAKDLDTILDIIVGRAE